MRDLQWQYPEAVEHIEARLKSAETAIERAVLYAARLEQRIEILEAALERADMAASRDYRKYALTRRVAGHEESRRAVQND